MNTQATSSAPSAWAAASQRARPLLQSVRGRLALVTLVLTLTAVLVALLLLGDSAREHRQSTEQQLSGTARALSLAVDGEIAKAQAVLQTLAASDALAHSDMETLDRQARAAIPGPDMWFVVQDETGAQVVNTLVPRGYPLPRTPAAGFRAQWERLVRQGQSVSGLSQGTLHPGEMIAVNLLAQAEDGRRYDLALLMTPQVFSQLLARQNLPQGWYGGIVDQDGYLIGRNVAAATFVGRRATPDAVVRMRSATAGVFESVSLDERATLAAFSRSALTGWSVAVAMPRSAAAGYVTPSLTQLFAGCLLILTVGVSAGLWFARGAGTAVASLRDAAERMGRGELTEPTQTGLQETDQIAEALYGAAQRLRAREDELRALNETLEGRVADSAAKLIQAHKLEALGRMTGGVAHDFNNLLTAVIGNLELLNRKLTDAGLARYAANAQAAAERGAKLTGQLLAFSRRQRLMPEPVDVNAVLGSMGGLLDATLGGSVRVETKLSKRLPHAVADRTQLELAILNLAINARDAMPDGGVVRIATAERRITHSDPHSELPEPGDYVAISVADEGVGMSPEILAKVFEPFFTTKPPGQGSGLGLPQTLGILKQLGGGLEIDSRIGAGTRVILLLPKSPAPSQGVTPAEPAEAEGLAGRSVLLVDDDPQLRAVAGALLQELGCEVRTAQDAAAALKIVRAGPLPDIVVVDFAMPGMNGVELARRIGELAPGLPIVLSSGYVEADDTARAWSGPFLPKPYALGELARVLKLCVLASARETPEPAA